MYENSKTKECRRSTYYILFLCQSIVGCNNISDNLKIIFNDKTYTNRINLFTTFISIFGILSDRWFMV
jgi:hypothetical protein